MNDNKLSKPDEYEDDEQNITLPVYPINKPNEFNYSNNLNSINFNKLKNQNKKKK
jgi:hypothetical protein